MTGSDPPEPTQAPGVESKVYLTPPHVKVSPSAGLLGNVIAIFYLSFFSIYTGVTLLLATYVEDMICLCMLSYFQ